MVVFHRALHGSTSVLVSSGCQWVRSLYQRSSVFYCFNLLNLLHKKLCRTLINSHVLTRTNPCIKQGNSCAVNAQLCCFTNKHSGAVIKTDVIINKVHSIDDISLCPGSGFFKMFAGNVLFRAIIGTGKKNVLKQCLQSFRATKMFLYNYRDQTSLSGLDFDTSFSV